MAKVREACQVDEYKIKRPLERLQGTDESIALSYDGYV